MAVTAGIGGAVQWNSVVIANIDTWTLSAKGATAKTTPFGASGSWETNTATIKDWTATCAGRLDPADTTGQLVLLNGLGSQYTLLLQLASGNYWSGTAVLVGLDPKSGVSTTVDVAISFEGNGTLTLTHT